MDVNQVVNGIIREKLTTLNRARREHITKAMDMARGNNIKAANLLNIAPSTLRRNLRKLSILRKSKKYRKGAKR